MSSYVDLLLKLNARRDVPLSTLTSMKVGGNADWVLDVTDENALAAVMGLGIDTVLLGNGTNVIATDEGFRGLVIRLAAPTFEPIWEGNTVTVSAGTLLKTLASDSVNRGYMGLERLCGIPGTVGGACAMNAGAYGAQLSDVLYEIKTLQNGVIAWSKADKAAMGYRKSPYCYPNCIVLAAKLILTADDGSARAVMEDCLKQRRNKQPLELPSAGSTFKRPEGHFAGALIEQCGLKGHRRGGASVSTKHAGFIVNDGNATANDVLGLIDEVRSTVLHCTGVELECEVKIIGR